MPVFRTLDSCDVWARMLIPVVSRFMEYIGVGGSGAPPTGFVPEAREGGSDRGSCPLYVCGYVRPDRQNAKNGNFTIFLFFGHKMVIFALWRAQTQKKINFLLKWVQNEFLVILAPKSLQIRQGFSLFFARGLSKRKK